MCETRQILILPQTLQHWRTRTSTVEVAWKRRREATESLPGGGNSAPANIGSAWVKLEEEEMRPSIGEALENRCDRDGRPEKKNCAPNSEGTERNNPGRVLHNSSVLWRLVP